jgi:hypothetical protein
MGWPAPKRRSERQPIIARGPILNAVSAAGLRLLRDERASPLWCFIRPHWTNIGRLEA